ncbi:MAG: chemotaxis protein CheB [Ktedonobacterales bacterium]|nr:chemotaxis protein CheB [Ktedonobacterales bacterium]
MHTHDIIVVGASAGGVEALMAFVAGLSPDFPGAVFVVLHIPANSPSQLAAILARAGPLPAKQAEDREAIQGGWIYTAPPDRHLLLTPDLIRLAAGPRENRSRPAVDPLFRTAALAFGPRVVGIVLSGALNDGTAGLLAIQRSGGVTLVQDPATALFPSMPASARTYVPIDGCLSIPELATRVNGLAHTPILPAPEVIPMREDLEFEAQVAGLDPTVLSQEQRPGVLTALTCPECRGPLWEIHDGALVRFRCRVGHAYTAETMVDEQAASVEDTLWMAFNSLTERAQLLGQLAVMVLPHQPAQAQVYQHQAAALHAQAIQIRQMLLPAP